MGLAVDSDRIAVCEYSVGIITSAVAGDSAAVYYKLFNADDAPYFGVYSLLST